MTHRLQLSVAIHAEQERAQRLGATARTGRPSADDALHRPECLDLYPGRRPRARQVYRVEPLGDDPFDSLLACRFEEGDAGPGETFASPDGAHRRERVVEASQALAQRLPGEVFAVRVEDVEDLIDDRSRFAELAHGALVAHVHPRLQALEARDTFLVERDDLAVEDRVVRAGQRLGGLCRLGILLGAVEKVARLKTDLTAINEGDRAHAVPFRFVREVRRVEWLVRGGREHRRDLRKEWIVLRRRAVLDHEPVTSLVLLRLHEDPLAIETLALHAQLQLVRLLLEQLVGAGVPDGHRAGAVAVRYHAMERQVLDRMVLGVHREPPLSGLERRTVRHRPRSEGAAHLKPNIPMEPRRMVPMNDVAARLFALRHLALRFGRAAEVAFALVLGEAHSVAFAIVGEGGA